MNTEPIVYATIARIEIPVTIGKERYILTEADGDAATRYRSASIRGVEMVIGEDGSRTSRHLDQIAEVEPVLISRCLYIADPSNTDEFILRLDKTGNPDNSYLVPITVIKRLPSKMQKMLFERTKEISELSEVEDAPSLEKQIVKLQERLAKLKAKEEETKKSSSTTQDGSA